MCYADKLYQGVRASLEHVANNSPDLLSDCLNKIRN